VSASRIPDLPIPDLGVEIAAAEGHNILVVEPINGNPPKPPATVSAADAAPKKLCFWKIRPAVVKL
jgi:hypothetical protein